MLKQANVELNRTQEKIMECLRPVLADGDKYVSYTKVGNAIHKPRATVKYNVNRLIRMGMLHISDGKLGLGE